MGLHLPKLCLAGKPQPQGHLLSVPLKPQFSDTYSFIDHLPTRLLKASTAPVLRPGLSRSPSYVQTDPRDPACEYRHTTRNPWLWSGLVGYQAYLVFGNGCIVEFLASTEAYACDTLHRQVGRPLGSRQEEPLIPSQSLGRIAMHSSDGWFA